MDTTRESMMAKITVIFFASLKEEIGVDEIQIDANKVGDLMSQLTSHFGKNKTSALFAENVRIAVNKELIEGDVEFSGHEEVAFLPPVTGG